MAAQGEGDDRCRRQPEQVLRAKHLVRHDDQADAGDADERNSHGCDGVLSAPRAQGKQSDRG